MIVIIDYGLGNLGSIKNMFKKVGVDATITSDLSIIEKAEKLILPGVGAFDNGMKNLSERGIIPVLKAKVFQDKTPILGLCLGMQLFCAKSEEGQLPGLGWLDADTIRFKFELTNKNLKIPHMGWNEIRVCQSHPIFQNLEHESRFYFVHSYHVTCRQTSNILAQTFYGYEFTSAVVYENIIGVQFHPEKSHKFGMQLFKNFLENI